MNNSYDEIISYLCIGSINAIPDYFKFSLIVNCTKLVDTNNLSNIINIPINDDPFDCKQLLHLIDQTTVLNKIHECIMNEQPVLVHCNAGMQRSCALVACYLIKYNNMNPITAIEFIRFKRPIAFFGNVNFQSAILLFYNKQKRLNINS